MSKTSKLGQNQVKMLRFLWRIQAWRSISQDFRTQRVKNSLKKRGLIVEDEYGMVKIRKNALSQLYKIV